MLSVQVRVRYRLVEGGQFQCVKIAARMIIAIETVQAVNMGPLLVSRVKSGNFGHQVILDIHLQTAEL